MPSATRRPAMHSGSGDLSTSHSRASLQYSPPVPSFWARLGISLASSRGPNGGGEWGVQGRRSRPRAGHGPRSVKGGRRTCPRSTLPRDPQEEGSQDPLHVTPRGRDPPHVTGVGARSPAHVTGGRGRGSLWLGPAPPPAPWPSPLPAPEHVALTIYGAAAAAVREPGSPAQRQQRPRKRGGGGGGLPAGCAPPPTAAGPDLRGAGKTERRLLPETRAASSLPGLSPAPRCMRGRGT